MPPYPRASALQQEKRPQWEVHALQWGSSPCSPQLEKSLHGNKGCPTVKVNKSFFFFNGILGMWSHIWKVFRIQKETQKTWVTYVTLQCWREKWTLMYLIHCIWESLGNNSLACTLFSFPLLFHITQSNSHSKLDHYVLPGVHNQYLMLFLSRVSRLPFSPFPWSLPVCQTLSLHLALPWTAHSITLPHPSCEFYKYVCACSALS